LLVLALHGQNFVNNLGGAVPDAGRAGDGRIEERLQKGAQSRLKRLVTAWRWH
jgi:hypothetical protein